MSRILREKGEWEGWLKKMEDMRREGGEIENDRGVGKGEVGGVGGENGDGEGKREREEQERESKRESERN